MFFLVIKCLWITYVYVDRMGLTTSKKQSVVFTRGREYALSDILETNYRLIKTVRDFSFQLAGQEPIKRGIYIDMVMEGYGPETNCDLLGRCRR